MASSLISRNVTVGGRRTSIRLESDMWDALREIGQRETMSAHQLCTLVKERRRESSLTAAVRVFIMSYFRTAAGRNGHEYRIPGLLSLGRQLNPEQRPPLASVANGATDLRAL